MLGLQISHEKQTWIVTRWNMWLWEWVSWDKYVEFKALEAGAILLDESSKED